MGFCRSASIVLAVELVGSAATIDFNAKVVGDQFRAAGSTCSMFSLLLQPLHEFNYVVVQIREVEPANFALDDQRTTQNGNVVFP